MIIRVNASITRRPASGINSHVIVDIASVTTSNAFCICIDIGSNIHKLPLPLMLFHVREITLNHFVSRRT